MPEKAMGPSIAVKPVRRVPRSVQALSLALIASLVLSSAGCVTGERNANRSQSRIAEGMSQEDVRTLLGPADRITPSKEGEIWSYSYGSRPDPRPVLIAAVQVLAILTIVGAYFVLIGLAGHGPPGEPDISGSFPEVRSPQVATGTIFFRVVFNREGRVVLVSGIEAGDDSP